MLWEITKYARLMCEDMSLGTSLPSVRGKRHLVNVSTRQNIQQERMKMSLYNKECI